MGLTKKQKKTLETLGTQNQNFKIRNIILKEKTDVVDQRLTTTYRSFIEHLEWIDKYYKVFDGRVRRNPQRVKDLILSINRKINNSTRRTR